MSNVALKSKKSPNPPRVLIIDDSLPWRISTERMLSGGGYEVITAQDGQEGLDLVFRERPDLILLDVVLPDMDGFAICERIRSTPEISSTPIIMLSGIQMESDNQAAGLETGADEYIVKPVGNRELLARVHARLRLKDAYDQVESQKRWLSTALDSITDAVLTVNRAGDILTINQSALKLLNLNMADAVGKSASLVLALLDPNHQPVILSPMFLNRIGFARTLPDARLMIPGGQEIPVRVRLSPTSTDKHALEGIVITIQDIREELADQKEQHLIFQLMDLMNRAIDPNEALGVAVELICRNYGWIYGEAWIPAPTGSQAISPPEDLDGGQRNRSVRKKQEILLQRSAVWHDESPMLAEFKSFAQDLFLNIEDRQSNQRLLEHKITWLEFPRQNSGSQSADSRSLTPPIRPKHRPGGSVGLQAFLTEAAVFGRLSSCVLIPLVSADELRGLIICFAPNAIEQTGRLTQRLNVLRGQVTEGLLHKQAQDNTIANERKLRSVLEQAHDGIVITDKNGSILTWNPAQAHITGIPADEAIGQKVWETQIKVAPPQLRTPAAKQQLAERIKEMLESISQNRSVRVSESAVHAQDGVVRAIQSAIFPIDTGQETLIVSISRDITQIHRAQEALEAVNSDLEERVRDRTLQLEMLFNLTNNLSFAPSFQELARLALSSLEQSIPFDLVAILLTTAEATVFVVKANRPVSADTLSVVETQIHNALYRMVAEEIHAVTPTVEMLRGENYDPDSQPIDTLRSIIQLPLSVKGKTFGVLLCGSEKEDIFGERHVRLMAAVNTQTASAIQGLQRSREAETSRMASMLDNLPEGLIVLNRAKRILLLNKQAETDLPLLSRSRTGDVLTQMGNMSVEEILGQDAEMEPTQHSVEIAIEKPTRIFRVTRQRLTEFGRQVETQYAWLLMFQDVTQEREQQRQLHAQERLATVGQLAAGIAHDFNNIMAVITLYSQMLMKNPEHPKRTAYLSTIDNQAGHAAKLISQILDFSRKAVMRRQRFSIAAFIEETTAMLDRTLPEHISVRYTYDHGDLIVNGDPTRLQQMLVNLALNARDAMPEGGTFAIDTSLLMTFSEQPTPISGMRPGIWVRITVSDTGTGMSEETLSRVFEPFYTTKPVGQGTGLGLAQAFGIVKQHGGEIEVTSHLGQGTTFNIYLPAVQLQLPRISQPAADTPLEHGKETILVAEDNEAARNAIEEILVSLGYHVLTVGDGQSAVDLYDRQMDQIDLIVCDMVMPGMGGIEVYQMVRAKNAAVRFVVATGYPLADNGASLLEQGIVGWIHKPFSMDQLAQLVRTALDQQR